MSVGQLFVVLQYLHVFHEVDVSLLGDGHHAATYVERGVLEDVEVATESLVLQVVGQEVQVYARVSFDGERVLDVIAVETNALFGNG